MTEINSKTFYPFTVKQLMVFQEELREAGGFHKLMRQKEVFHYNGGTWEIATQDIEYYKNKYLTGIYKPLQAYYVTETPVIFWAKMNEILKKAEALL